MHPHLAGDKAKDNVSVFQLDLESCVGEVLNDLTLHLDVVFFSHCAYLIIGDPLKFAFFKRLSYWWDMT